MPDPMNPTEHPEPLADVLRRGVTPPGSNLDVLRQRAEDLAAQARSAPAEPEEAPAPLDDELDGWLAADMLDEDGEYRSPGGEAQADQLLGVLAHLTRRAGDIKVTAQARVDKIAEWARERTESIDRERARIETLLEGWTRAQHEASGGKTVTWKLPAGELRLRPQQRKIHVLDDKATSEALRTIGQTGLLQEHPVTWTVSKTRVKERAGEELGPVAADVLVPEPGYVMHHIPVPGTDPADGEFLPGVFMLVPVEARKFTAAPK